MAILDIVVLLGLMVQNPAAAESRDPQSMPAAPQDPSLDRIRSRLQNPPVVAVPNPEPPSTSSSGRPLFQIHVEAPLVEPFEWLENRSVPNYVRPTYTLTHHEFMLNVTPEMFRGVSTHPYGIPAMSVSRTIAKAVRGPLKRRKEAKARQEVADALAACRAAGGCIN